MRPKIWLMLETPMYILRCRGVCFTLANFARCIRACLRFEIDEGRGDGFVFIPLQYYLAYLRSYPSCRIWSYIPVSVTRLSSLCSLTPYSMFSRSSGCSAYVSR